jgi:hypothetical protein
VVESSSSCFIQIIISTHCEMYSISCVGGILRSFSLSLIKSKSEISSNYRAHIDKLQRKEGGGDTYLISGSELECDVEVDD